MGSREGAPELCVGAAAAAASSSSSLPASQVPREPEEAAPCSEHADEHVKLFLHIASLSLSVSLYVCAVGVCDSICVFVCVRAHVRVCVFRCVRASLCIGVIGVCLCSRACVCLRAHVSSLLSSVCLSVHVCGCASPCMRDFSLCVLAHVKASSLTCSRPSHSPAAKWKNSLTFRSCRKTPRAKTSAAWPGFSSCSPFFLFPLFGEGAVV